MFCVKCGREIIDEDVNFCFNCGENLNVYQEKITTSNKEPENDFDEFEKNQSMDISEEDYDAKIQNLTEVISKLQDENKRLIKELEKYTSKKSEASHRRSEFGKKMPTPAKDDMFTKFKKWYNE